MRDTLLLILALAFVVILPIHASNPEPPVAKRILHQTNIHGQTLDDYYYWLRNKEEPAVQEYLVAENQYAEAVTNHTKSLQSKLYEEFIARISENDNYFQEIRIGNYFYYSKIPANASYEVWYRRHVAQTESYAILDENELVIELDTDYLYVGAITISPDEEILAYTVDTHGGEVFTLYFKNLTDMTVFKDTVPNVYYSIQWASDSRTIFYNVMDTKALQPMSVCKHILGSGIADKVMIQEKDLTFALSVTRTNDNRFIVVYLQGMVTNEVYYLPSDDPDGDFQLLFPRKDNVQYYLESHMDKFYLNTNRDIITNFKILEVDIENPNDTSLWREIVPADDSVYITSMQVFKDHMVLWELEDTLQQICVLKFEDIHTTKRSYSAYMQRKRDFGLCYYVPVSNSTWYSLQRPDEIGEYNVLIYTSYTTTQLRFSYTSFITPLTYYTFHLNNYTLEETMVTVYPNYDPSLYADERLFISVIPEATDAEMHQFAYQYPSSELLDPNTTVPVTIVYRKDRRKKDGNPMLLNGYGAYGTVNYPEFDPLLLSLLDRGFIVGLVHIRGGGMKGWQWYLDGKLLKKKNTFFDFVTCVNYFVDKGWTSRDWVAVHGRSAGGLLMGSILTYAPMLVNTVWMQVPFVDVINTQLDPTIPWVVWEFVEWGNPQNETYFEYMKQYDPYGNVGKREYCNILVQSGWNDSRVMYWEPTKLVAKLRYSKTDNNIVLLKTSDVGHMGGTGDYYYVDAAFEYAFIINNIAQDEKGSNLLVIDLAAVAAAILAVVFIVWSVWKYRDARRKYQLMQ